MKIPAVFDIEIYKNYFLLAIRVLETGRVYTFERGQGFDFDVEACKSLLRKLTVIGFNSKNFDELILALALNGASPKLMKEAANAIIIYNEKIYRLFSQYGVKPLAWMDHIDLIEVAPGAASLKIYNGRFHGKRMQDLPYPHDATLTEQEMDVVKDYCVNDLVSTELLFTKVEERIQLREKMSEEYDVDLRSKSDAQVAEAVIKHELKALGVDVHVPKIEPGTTFFYEVPHFAKFHNPALREIVSSLRTTPLRVGANGEIEFPAWIVKEPITIGKMRYQMGKGGLHSTEKSCHYIADDDTIIADRDVTSYYPAIILNLGLYPKHLGKGFLKIFRHLVEERVAAKKAKNKVKAESLKITVNGTFGKLGSKYSILYSPDLLLQVTLTGQLSLLLLIEWMEEAGIEVVSANTDGVVMRFSKSQKSTYDEIVSEWEKATGFDTEETLYKAIYMANVNNYIAFKVDN